MTGYGPPGASSTSAGKKQTPIFELVAVLLGLLAFIWGFLPFYGSNGTDLSVKGYATGSAATGAIALTVLAGALAGALIVSEEVKSVRPPYALAAAVAALLLTLGALFVKGDGITAKIGLWLLLITALAEVAVLGYAWATATGKLSAKANAAGAQQWGGAPQYGQPGQGQPGQLGQGQPGYGQGQPPAYGSPQPTSAPQPGAYPPPGSFGQPPSSPSGGYGSSTQHQGGPGGYNPAQPQPGQRPPGQSQPGQGQGAPPQGGQGQGGPGQAPQGGYGQQPPSGGFGQ